MIIEEIQTWSADDALIQIHMLLPEGWHFRPTIEDGLTSASITDASGAVVWESEEPLPDRRLVLLDAYGWLYYRQHRTTNAVWVRRHEVDRRAIVGQHGLPGVGSQPDPGDLDPVQIEEIVRKKSGRPV